MIRRLRKAGRDLLFAVSMAAALDHFRPLIRRIPVHAMVYGGMKILLAAAIGIAAAILFCFVLAVMLVGGDWVGEKML